MNLQARRQFLSQVGQGALLAGLGPLLCQDLGLGKCLADESPNRLRFGELDPLVALMEETPLEQFVPVLVDVLRGGTPPAKVVAAAALANARALGGEDYVGYHAFMALAPAYAMTMAEPAGPRQMLPVIKVLYRNTKQIQEHRDEGDTLHPIDHLSNEGFAGEQLRDFIRKPDIEAAEGAFASIAQADAERAFNEIQLAIQDDLNVHRVVLVWRAWALLPLTGPQHAHTMLRQSVRFCVDSESHRIQRGQPEPAIRQQLPALVDQYKLFGTPLGTRQANDEWLDQLTDTIYLGSPYEAAEAVANAIAEGFAPAAIAEATALAANRLVLCDPGRPERWASDTKPVGSVHGDSTGVHASDAANAWRNIAQSGNHRTAVASLVAAAFHTAGQQRSNPTPYPTPQHLEIVSDVPADKLLPEIDAAIRNRDQQRTCALAHRYGDLNQPAAELFALLRRFAITEDGALHAEKYYETVSEEFQVIRPSRRWRQLVGLSRVTASQYGFPAPGVDVALNLLG